MAEHQKRTEFNVAHPTMGIGALTTADLRAAPAEVIEQGVQAETEIVKLRAENQKLRATILDMNKRVPA